mgnify:CR=1 FL=1
MGREENKKVFMHTESMCSSNKRIRESMAATIKGQEVFLEKDEIIRPDLNVYKEKPQILVSKKRTFEAASSYASENRVVVHNFASASNPGGGVAKGASAQEECLCRCSDLYFCLSTQEMMKVFYEPHRKEHNPLHNDDIIYTPQIIVFKTDSAEPKLMKESDWYEVDVITCAAPNLRQKPSNSYNRGDGNRAIKMKDRELLALHEKRLRRILDVAVMNGDDTIILGAFGCGAFMNSPEVVALAAKNVISDYLNAFKNIEFAVYCSPKDDRNYKVFHRILKPYLP